MKININNIIICFLVINVIVFFIPWFTMNIESEVLSHDTMISGFKLAKYGGNLQSLTMFLNEGLKRNMVNLLLIFLRFILVLPLLDVAGAILLAYRIRFARTVINIGFILTLLVSLSIIFVTVFNSTLSEFIGSLFVMTPSLYIMMITSILGLFMNHLNNR